MKKKTAWERSHHHCRSGEADKKKEAGKRRGY